VGLVRTEITLKNAADEILAKEGHIGEDEIRQVTVNALVDTGAWALVINKEIQEKLGLNIVGTGSGTLANGVREWYNRAGPLKIIWKDRSSFLEALVVPNAKGVLLGAIPLEALDLIVNPLKGEVVGAHGDEMEYLLF
jgi:clan AA aspartic protease